MESTRNHLLFLFWTVIGLTAFIYVYCELLGCDIAIMEDCSAKTLYIYSTVMILLTLGLVPLSLRLFKFGRVHRQLVTQRESALLRWGFIRINILGLLLIANTLLYYIYAFESAFGYLAVMVLLSMPFILPTMSRCQSEIEEE
jgi:hypothetical protein